MLNAPSYLVSVIIPAYDSHTLLRRALKSVYEQKIDDLEVIVVDDASRQQITIHEFPRLRIVRHNQNRGAAAARNTGLTSAKGQYIAFLDSDDIWENGKLDAQIRHLDKAARSCAGVFTPFSYQGRFAKQFNPALNPTDWFDYFLMGCRVAPGSTLLAHKSALDKIGPQDEKLRRYEDWDWLLRAAQHYHFTHSVGPGAVLGSPSRALSQSITPALQRIENKWKPQLTGKALGYFMSALHLEKAVSSRWHNKKVSSALHLLKATTLSPRTVAYSAIWRGTGLAIG